jgi:hypothetical protein
MYDGASLRNSLPDNIRESKMLSSFEKKIAYPSLLKHAIPVNNVSI